MKKGSEELRDAVRDSAAETASGMFDAEAEAVADERSELEAVAVDIIVAVSVTEAASTIRLDECLNVKGE